MMLISDMLCDIFVSCPEKRYNTAKTHHLLRLSPRSTMANAHQLNTLAQVADLHIDKKYADMKIECEGRRFEVHRAVVCKMSPVIARIIDGNMWEATTKVIVHKEYDVHTVVRMLSYMYTQDYRVSGQTSDSACAANAPAGKFLDWLRDLALLRPCLGSATSASQAKLPTAANTILIDHIHVFGLAEYYEVLSLQDLAAERFRNAITSSWQQETFAKVVIEAYRCADVVSNRTLIDALLAATVAHSAELVADRRLWSALESEDCHDAFLHGFLNGLSNALVESKSEHAADRVNLRALADAASAGRDRVTADLATARADVVKARKDTSDLERLVDFTRTCRHCRYDFQTRLEKETWSRCSGKHCWKCTRCGTTHDEI